MAHARVAARAFAARAIAAGAAAAVAGALIAGCGIAHSRIGVLRAPGPPVPLAHAGPWPPGGSPAVARAFGKRMLARLVLPPGSRRISARQVPPRGEVIASGSLVDLDSFFSIPTSVLVAADFVRLYTPTGFLPNESVVDSTSTQSGAFYPLVSFNLRSAPTGIASDTMLVVSFAEGPHGSTVARADAEIIWYPPRTAAEYIRPGAISSARVTAIFLSPNTHRISKVITSRRAIAGLATLLNGLRAAEKGDWLCGTSTSEYKVTFTGGSGQPLVSVRPDVCPLDDIMVNGSAQPPLWDPKGHLVATLRSLLGLNERHG
jgi:hypothetical protein